MVAVNRRTVLQGMAYAGLYGGLAADVFRAAQALEPDEIAGSDAELHLLRRISFGPTAATLARARAIGRTAYIEEQLVATDGQTGTTAQALYPLITLSSTSLFATTGGGFVIDSHLQHLQAAMLHRALFSSAQLKEVMVDFWNDHFNTHVRKNPIPLKIDFDRDVIRPHALGNFRTLLKATVRSGEMLHYLDNWLNRKDAINENYARELLELHSMGKGNYLEADMKALSRILSGLSYINDLVGSPLTHGSVSYGQVVFLAAEHDDGEKVFLGQTFPAGGGEDEIDRALDLILAQPATARFIAEKLCRRFVSDQPPITVVDAVAATFTSSGGDIKAMLRVLLNSTEFAASRGTKLKRPQEAMIGALRACGLTLTDALANTNVFGFAVASPNGILYQGLQQAGHLPFNWVPPNGYPDTASYWGNTNTQLYQQKFLVGLVEGTGFSYVLSDPVNALQFGNSVASGSTRARTPRQAVDNAIANLLFQPLPAEARNAALAFVAQDADPEAEMDGGVLEQRVKGLVFVLLASPWSLLR